MKTKYIFLHIQKTAGNTFRKHIIDNIFDKSEVFHIVGSLQLNDYFELTTKEKNRIQLISGHIPFGLHNEINNEVKYLTFLRNPVDRIISHYGYAKRASGHQLYEQVKYNNMSLREFSLNEDMLDLDNGQVRQISGSTKPVGKISKEDLELAKYNIEKYFEIGITEYFLESCVSLKEKLDWHGSFLYCNENVTKKNAESLIDSETIKIIEHRNKFDIELYNWAFGRFRKSSLDIKSYGLKMFKYRVMSYIKKHLLCNAEKYIKKLTRKIKKNIKGNLN